MAVIQLTDSYLTATKRALRAQCDARSAHLSEAIARGCGFRTNAALNAALHSNSAGCYLPFDERAFCKRLVDLGEPASREIALPDLGRVGRYLEDHLRSPTFEAISIHPQWAQFKLNGIGTAVRIDLEDNGGGCTRFRRSHAIHTPLQMGPYWPSRDFDDDPAYAMNRAINSIADYYDAAVNEGHLPQAGWLIVSHIPGQQLKRVRDVPSL